MLNVVALLTTKHNGASAHGERAFWKERGAEYARKLFNGVARHLPTPFRPWLITDTPEATPVGVGAVRVPIAMEHAGARGWWAKLSIFAPEFTFHTRTPFENERVLYLDLDNVIGGDLTPIVSLRPNPLFMLDDVVYPGMRNGSTLYFRPGHFTDAIYSRYVNNPRGVEQEFSVWPHASDQAYIASMHKDFFSYEAPTMQSRLPTGMILNSRAELEKGAAWDKTALVYGSWDPQPHESSHPYYARNWV